MELDMEQIGAFQKIQQQVSLTINLLEMFCIPRLKSKHLRFMHFYPSGKSTL